MIVRVVADSHGHWLSVHQMAVDAVGTADVVLLAGDAGFGFPQAINPPPGLDFPLPMWFLRGNHDNPEVTMCWPGWSQLKDGARIGNAVFVGGGNSIDKAARFPGLDWWPGEEVTRASVDHTLRDLEGVDVVVTHDAPHERYPWFPPTQSSSELGVLAKALHDRGGDVLWVHGHHHRPTVKQVENIKYVCLAPTHNEWDGDKRFIDVEVRQ